MLCSIASSMKLKRKASWSVYRNAESILMTADMNTVFAISHSHVSEFCVVAFCFCFSHYFVILPLKIVQQSFDQFVSFKRY